MNQQTMDATIRACLPEQLTAVEWDILRLTGARFAALAPGEDFVMLTREKPEWDRDSQRWRPAEGYAEGRVDRVRTALFPSVRPGECVRFAEEVADGEL